jgi:hypothetical protein
LVDEFEKGLVLGVRGSGLIEIVEVATETSHETSVDEFGPGVEEDEAGSEDSEGVVVGGAGEEAVYEGEEGDGVGVVAGMAHEFAVLLHFRGVFLFCEGVAERFRQDVGDEAEAFLVFGVVTYFPSEGSIHGGLNGEGGEDEGVGEDVGQVGGVVETDGPEEGFGEDGGAAAEVAGEVVGGADSDDDAFDGDAADLYLGPLQEIGAGWVGQEFLVGVGIEYAIEAILEGVYSLADLRTVGFRGGFRHRRAP